MKTLNKLLAICGLLFFEQSALAAGDITGRVAETIEVKSYVYVLLEDSDSWLAVSLMDVQVGDVVEYSGGLPMANFHSRELDRNFEDILFVTKFSVVETANSHGVIADPHALGNDGADVGLIKAESAKPPSPGEIERLESGKTIKEALFGADELEGQEVSIRARVLKVSMNVLGKNWVTLQDGTGLAPDNKLIATTSETAEIGETVIAKGVLKTNVDIGSGYQYRVILEEATFSK